MLKGVESGRCIDVSGSQASGTVRALWDCNNDGANQQWTATASKQLQVFGNKCLEVTGGGTARTAPAC